MGSEFGFTFPKRHQKKMHVALFISMVAVALNTALVIIFIYEYKYYISLISRKCYRRYLLTDCFLNFSYKNYTYYPP